MKLDTNTKTLTLAVGEIVTLQCVAADAISPPFTLPTAAVLTQAQQVAKTEALKTALPMAQSNPDQLRKLDGAFYELMTSRITDPDVIRRYQESKAGMVCMPFQALVSVAPEAGCVDVLIGIWSACQDALKTVK
jgi:hypothetical protein